MCGRQKIKLGLKGGLFLYSKEPLGLQISTRDGWAEKVVAEEGGGIEEGFLSSSLHQLPDFFLFFFFNVRSSLPDPTQFVFFVSNQFTRPSPHNHNDDGRRSSSGSSNKMPVHFSTGLILAEGRKKKRRFFFKEKKT